MENENRRVYAADWFMRAAAMPCSLIFAVFYSNQPLGSTSKFLLIFLATFAGPVVIAGGWGAALGVKILDPETTRGAGQAALKGFAVALASFVTYIFAFCLCVTGFDLDPRGDFYALFLLYLVCGTIFTGWLVFPVGAIAGALLYKKQGKPN